MEINGRERTVVSLADLREAIKSAASDYRITFRQVSDLVVVLADEDGFEAASVRVPLSIEWEASTEAYDRHEGVSYFAQNGEPIVMLAQNSWTASEFTDDLLDLLNAVKQIVSVVKIAFDGVELISKSVDPDHTQSA